MSRSVSFILSIITSTVNKCKFSHLLSSSFLFCKYCDVFTIFLECMNNDREVLWFHPQWGQNVISVCDFPPPDEIIQIKCDILTWCNEIFGLCSHFSRSTGVSVPSGWEELNSCGTLQLLPCVSFSDLIKLQWRSSDSRCFQPQLRGTSPIHVLAVMFSVKVKQSFV